MIDRLQASLRALSELAADDMMLPWSAPLRQDCADALRLQLDCMQAELGASERAVLQRLNDLLEVPAVPGTELAAAVQAALIVLNPDTRILPRAR